MGVRPRKREDYICNRQYFHHRLKANKNKANKLARTIVELLKSLKKDSCDNLYPLTITYYKIDTLQVYISFGKYIFF